MSIKKIIYPTQGSPYSETFVKAEMELLKNSGVIVEFIDVNALPISITNMSILCMFVLNQLVR
jgi:hypothetical protein